MNKTCSRLFPKGSVLVFSLVILSVMLVTSLTLLSSAVFQEKAALSTGASTHSFQIADSGVEQVLYQIYKRDRDSIGDIAAGLGLTCPEDAIITDADAGWTVRFYDSDGNRFTDCDTSRDAIAAIKSEGSAQGTTRAVQVAVAQTSSDFETGMIVMWSGAIDEIPDGWALCDGDNGTPDLTDRFVVGAGGDYSSGASGGNRDTTLAVGNIPSHQHFVARYEHLVPAPTPLTSSSSLVTESDRGNGGSYYIGRSAGVANVGLSSPIGSGSSFTNMPPYLALAYIMKVD